MYIKKWHRRIQELHFSHYPVYVKNKKPHYRLGIHAMLSTVFVMTSIFSKLLLSAPPEVQLTAIRHGALNLGIELLSIKITGGKSTILEIIRTG